MAAPARRGPAGTVEGAETIFVVKGEDPSVVALETRALVARLVGDRDPALVVEEHGGSSAEDLDVGAVMAACTTPPFLLDRRVVVVRDAGRLSAADGARLADALADPPPSTVLVLVGGGGTVPPALSKLAAARGGVVEGSVRNARDRSRWVAEHVRHGPVRLDGPAVGRLEEHLGEDVGRIEGLLGSLAAAYGEGARVGVAELEPFLGEAGSVPPWDLTDAIDRGATAEALGALHRMMGAGGRPPQVLLASLHRHYADLLRLDGAPVGSPEDAAALLGSSAFPARKALEQSRRLGSERITRAIGLVAGADLDLKGQSALAPELVLEVLVARLSRLVRQRPARHR